MEARLQRTTHEMLVIELKLYAVDFGGDVLDCVTLVVSIVLSPFVESLRLVTVDH